MSTKGKGSTVNAARLENNRSHSKDSIHSVESNSTGILEPLQAVAITGAFRQELVGFINDCRQHGVPNGCTFELDCSGAHAADTDLTLGFGHVLVQLALCGYKPTPRISIQALSRKIQDINNESSDAERVAERLEHSGCTLLTSSNPRELLKGMRDGLERGNRLAFELMDQIEDPRSWLNAVPDNVMIIGRARLAKGARNEYATSR